MATVAWSFVLCVFASLLSLSEGACYQDPDVVNICEANTRSGVVLFLNANTTINATGVCSCTIRQTSNGNMEINPMVGSTTGTSCSADVVIKFYYVQATPIYKVACLTDSGYTGYVAANTNVELNMTGPSGPGRINSCITMRSLVQGASITLTCKTQIEIEAPPTTQAPSTTPAPTTTAPTTQPPGSTTQPTGTTTQAPAQTTTQPGQTTQPQGQTTQPQGQTTQPQGQTTQPQGQTTQPQGQTTQPQGQTTQPQGQTTQPTGSTTQLPPTSTEGFLNRFPVPEIAGGVAAGILIIILLVVCVTCCTSRKRSKRQPDEESLNGRDSPEMQEKGGRGYAFDNMLYHASQRDLSGKSVTPTVSDADPQDYQATKGLEELYASVNKTITDSTDIM